MKTLNSPLPFTNSLLLLSLLALAIFFGSPASSDAATTLFTETFEGAFPGPWSVGNANTNGLACYWDHVPSNYGTLPNGAHGGGWMGYCAAVGHSGTVANPTYQNNMKAYMSRTIDLSSYNKASLTFWYKIPSIEKRFDFAKVYVDSNVLWSTDVKVTNWTQVILGLNRFTGASHTLNFQFESDSSVTYEGWYLDDISVTADNIAGPPGAPVLNTPNNWELLARESLQFSWSEPAAAAPAQWYRLYVTCDGEKYLDQWTQNWNWAPINPNCVFPGGGYVAWVQGWNASGLGAWSTPHYFSVKTNVPAKPTLGSPSGTVTSTVLSYQWNYDATCPWYELCITKNGAVFSDQWVNTYYKYVYGHGSGPYKWWVRGWNPDGMGPWSDVGTFSVSLVLPSALRLNAPVGLVSPIEAKWFSWNADQYADWYCFMLNCNNTNVLTQWVQNYSYYVLSNALPVGNYTWCARAWNSEGMGPWSTNATFTVGANGTPCGPDGSFSVGTGDISYEWIGDNTCTWYQLYVNRNGALFYQQWIPSTACTSSSGIIHSPVISGHTAGSYSFWVCPYSTATGTGPWSAAGYFTLTP